MTWSYALTLATPKDQIRLLIGDNQSAYPLIQDEEIAFILADEGNLYRAAASCAEVISAQFTRQVDYAVGQSSVQEKLSQRSAQFATLAQDLRRRANRDLVAYVGGLSIAEKLAAQANTDAVQPAFTRGQFAHPGVGQNDEVTEDLDSPG